MVAMHRSRGGDEIAVAVIPMTALQLDQGRVRRGSRLDAGEGSREMGRRDVLLGPHGDRGTRTYR
jgi:hypothetical protein